LKRASSFSTAAAVAQVFMVQNVHNIGNSQAGITVTGGCCSKLSRKGVVYHIAVHDQRRPAKNRACNLGQKRWFWLTFDKCFKARSTFRFDLSLRPFSDPNSAELFLVSKG